MQCQVAEKYSLAFQANPQGVSPKSCCCLLLPGLVTLVTVTSSRTLSLVFRFSFFLFLLFSLLLSFVNKKTEMMLLEITRSGFIKRQKLARKTNLFSHLTNLRRNCHVPGIGNMR